MFTAEGAKLQKLIDDTRKRLVETGTRNRLIHVNGANTRGHCRGCGRAERG